MSDAPRYPYTSTEVNNALNEIVATLFADKTADTLPKMLVTAGVESSGKTYLLEKSLLPSRRYENFVRLYLPDYRTRHPHYAEMSKEGVLHVYQHTEAFVRELGEKIFGEAFKRKLNIIMECAFDAIDFVHVPTLAKAAGYQFDIHVVGCNREFAHVSGIKRALKSLENRELERFVSLDTLQFSLGNAQAILLAFESAAKTVAGSQISLYERGFGHLKERILRAQSTFSQAHDGSLVVSSSATVYSLSAYSAIVNRLVYSLAERDEMIKECHWLLAKTTVHADQVPDFVYHELYGHIIKYVNR